MDKKAQGKDNCVQLNPRIAVFPGTFDPITSGHFDVIQRGAVLFEKLIVSVASYTGSKEPLFQIGERVEIITKLCKDLPNVEVTPFEGMTVDFAHAKGAKFILRGIRSFSDFDHEFQLAVANRHFGDIETVFVMASEENSFVRSALIKEAVALGADVTRFVPKEVAQRLKRRLSGRYGRASGLAGHELPR